MLALRRRREGNLVSLSLIFPASRKQVRTSNNISLRIINSTKSQISRLARKTCLTSSKSSKCFNELSRGTTPPFLCMDKRDQVKLTQWKEIHTKQTNPTPPGATQRQSLFRRTSRTQESHSDRLKSCGIRWSIRKTMKESTLLFMCLFCKSTMKKCLTC